MNEYLGTDNFSSKYFLIAIENAASVINTHLFDFVTALRQRGYKTAVISNNFYGPNDDTTFYSKLSSRFDLFIESRVVKINKPDPEIYKLCLNQLGILPCEALFLDDIPINLRNAKALGINTIRVSNETQAIQDLKQFLGIPIAKL